MIRLNFDQAELTPPEERPSHKCVSCGLRIYRPHSEGED